MRGQWIGRTTGDKKGHITLNLDSDSKGRVSFIDYDASLPSAIAEVKLVKFNAEGEVEGELFNFLAFDHEQKLLKSPKTIIGENSNVDSFSESGSLKGKVKDTTLSGSWSTKLDNGNSLQGGFELQKYDNKSQYKLNPISWKKFKDWINENKSNIENNKIFRGHEDSAWALRTTFNRNGRFDLIKYFIEDVSEIKELINTKSNYIYKEDSVYDVRALLSLIQHHGFPTPLLDWTKSPYIATYFAIKNSEKNKNYVRVFSFSAQDWIKDKNYNLEHHLDPMPGIKSISLPAFNNPRSIPQQSVFMFTNVDYLEGFIKSKENSGHRYLSVFDIPSSEREEVLYDLDLMGINEASLFPGYDGICKYLKYKKFNSN